jgi:hypothetical protein
MSFACAAHLPQLSGIELQVLVSLEENARPHGPKRDHRW